MLENFSFYNFLFTDQVHCNCTVQLTDCHILRPQSVNGLNGKKVMEDFHYSELPTNYSHSEKTLITGGKSHCRWE